MFGRRGSDSGPPQQPLGFALQVGVGVLCKRFQHFSSVICRAGQADQRLDADLRRLCDVARR